MAREWTAALSVGFPLIDAEHQELFRRVNQLMTAVSAGEAATEAPRLLMFLADYVVAHFAHEEALMARYSYPGGEAHKRQHEGFMARVRELRAQFAEQGAAPTLVLSICRDVHDWLVNHISKSDVVLGAYLRQKCAA